MHFERLWYLADLEILIVSLEQALALTPNGHLASHSVSQNLVPVTTCGLSDSGSTPISLIQSLAMTIPTSQPFLQTW